MLSRVPLLACAALAAALLLSRDTVTVDAQAPTPPAPCAAAPVPGNSEVALRSGGVDRFAILHLPPGVAAGRRIPLVLALGGAGQTGPDFARLSRYSGVADHEGFAVAYPTAVGSHPFWNMSGVVPGKPDDVAFFRDLLDALGPRLCFDRDRVYATGVSNGGGMTARLGCELSDRLAAIAPVAGGYKALPACHPSRPVSVLEIHGAADPVVPYDGRGSTHDGSATRYASMWARLDRCRPGPARRAPAPDVTRLEWRGCAAGTQVSHLRLEGVKHVWPRHFEPDGSETAISATGETWRFFRRHVRAPAP